MGISCVGGTVWHADRAVGAGAAPCSHWMRPSCLCLVMMGTQFPPPPHVVSCSISGAAAGRDWHTDEGRKRAWAVQVGWRCHCRQAADQHGYLLGCLCLRLRPGRNVLATTRSIVKANGFRGLWRGSGPSVVRMGLGVGLHMVLVDYAATALTKKLEDGGTHLSSLNAALAGGGGKGGIQRKHEVKPVVATPHLQLPPPLS